MYVYVCVCMCMCVYVCVGACVCVCVCVYMYVYVYVYVHGRMDGWMHACMHACMYVCISLCLKWDTQNANRLYPTFQWMIGIFPYVSPSSPPSGGDDTSATWKKWLVDPNHFMLRGSTNSRCSASSGVHFDRCRCSSFCPVDAFVLPGVMGWQGPCFSFFGLTLSSAQ